MSSTFDERAKQRIQELIELGERVEASRPVTRGGKAGPDPTLYYQWTTSSPTFLAAALGEDSEHYKRFAGIRHSVERSGDKVPQYLGVLHAAKDDIDSGWVGRRDLLLTADAFQSFLEQADYLLEQEYKDPAAMLAGAVLESTLRKICDVHGVPYGPKDTIEPLNVALAKRTPPLYNKLVQSQITVWAALRNKAAPGRYTEYTKGQVADMLKWVREFAARHLA